MEIPIIVAVLGAASAVVAAVVSARAQHNVRQLGERFEQHRQVTAFLTEQLSKLYLPVSMHLRATRALASTHYEADEATKEDIEHALRHHNNAIVECLMTWSMYLDPNAAEEVAIGLLEHLLQWESVYNLKYKYGELSGPVWDGIRHFGYRRFPDEAADHFHEKAAEIREELHERLRRGV